MVLVLICVLNYRNGCVECVIFGGYILENVLRYVLFFGFDLFFGV